MLACPDVCRPVLLCPAPLCAPFSQHILLVSPFVSTLLLPSPTTTTTATASTIHRSPASRQTNPASTTSARSEHRRIPVTLSVLSCPPLKSRALVPQHIRHNKQPHMRAPNVHAIQMSDPTITLSDIDVLHLYVHVVLRCAKSSAYVLVFTPLSRTAHTFNELPAVRLSGGDFNRDLVTLREHASATMAPVSARPVLRDICGMVVHLQLLRSGA